MCGRYLLQDTTVAISHRFALTRLQFEVVPRYNIAPSQTVPVILWNGERCLAGHRWGLIPSWAPEESIGNRLINARAETLAEKPAFRGALRQRRCLLPANGFYEWTGAGKPRQPVHIRLCQGALFALAGLWEEWRSPEGQPLRTCTIITVPPNALIAPLHARMPAMLLPEHEAPWLDPATPVPDLAALLRPYPAEAMECFPVSTLVNSPAIDRPECAAPREPPM